MAEVRKKGKEQLDAQLKLDGKAKRGPKPNKRRTYKSKIQIF